MLPGAKADAVIAQLASVGFRLQTHSTINPYLMEGFLPLSAVRAASNVSGIHSLHASQRPMRHAGSVQSQAVALQKADIAQQRGFDGKGIRVATLSDSYDACKDCTTHAADDIASGDLPAEGVTVIQELDPILSEGATGEDEGRAMLQLVHDVAPGRSSALRRPSTVNCSSRRTSSRCAPPSTPTSLPTMSFTSMSRCTQTASSRRR